MPAKGFICPDGKSCTFKACQEQCRMKTRCMAKPAIAALADKSKDRGLELFSATELLKGIRELYLEKLYDYTVSPDSQVLAFEGTGLHRINEETALRINEKSEDTLLIEERLENDIATGQIDCYGHIFNDYEAVICDYKMTTCRKIAKANRYGYIYQPTGQVYKQGEKKGLPKLTKVFTNEAAQIAPEWILQQNFYKLLLEEYGYKVDRLFIQAYARDFSGQMINQTGISQPQMVIELGIASPYWIRLWYTTKLELIKKAIKTRTLPPLCSDSETWGGLKCRQYCNVAHICRELEKEQGMPELGSASDYISDTEAAKIFEQTGR